MAETTDTTASPKNDFMVEVDGMRFPVAFQTNRPMKEQIECINSLEMRQDDVIVCAYAKSGTHWLWEVASMLLMGKAKHEERTKEFAMMEATEIEKIQDQPSPRLLNTHLPVHMLPVQVKGKRVKIIHVYRNVKDVVVSLLFHIRQYPERRDTPLEDLVHRNVDQSSKDSYISYLLEMDKFIKDNPDLPIFNVSYEDTKENPVSVVSRLGEFLGVKASPELCADIAQATSFSSMKEADTKKKQPQHLYRVQMYRKGEVGDWKNHMTVAQSEQLDAAMKPLESCSNFRFRYTL